jgi:hypothetical protein
MSGSKPICLPSRLRLRRCRQPVDGVRMME